MVGTGLLLTINGAYLHIFLSADKVTPETIRYGNAYLHIDLAMYPFLAFIFVMRNCVQGIGRPQFILGAGTAELVARVTVCLLRRPCDSGRSRQRGRAHARFLRDVRRRPRGVDVRGRGAVRPVHTEHPAFGLPVLLSLR